MALDVKCDGNRVDVFRVENDEPILSQHAKANTRAYIHPIVAPDGCGVLTEDTPPHHPWQHGLYVGLNDVNGVGFWTEGLQEKRKDVDGTFHPHAIEQAVAKEDRVSWTVVSDWRDPNGDVMLIETQAWTLTDRGDTYFLDVDWSLSAAVDLAFGEYAYGGLFLRMPYQRERGGEAVSSEGLINGDAEGQRAKWVSVSMPIEGRDDWSGIAMLDHPNNLEHPNPWRVDNQLGIVPSRCIAGSWTLAQGETSLNRYRLLVFLGQTDRENIETAWKHFAEGRG